MELQEAIEIVCKLADGVHPETGQSLPDDSTASSNTLLVGTCQIWGGSSTGGSFSLLSPDFENGGPGVCSGTETNVVRAIAAGGPHGRN